MNPTSRPPQQQSHIDQAAHGRQKRRQSQSGIAIVTVLSVLMLMSVLVLAFFSAANTELEASRHYASSLRTHQLTDIVTNMVIAQIREATAPTTVGTTRTTWASQPGLITTFRDRGSSYEQLVASKFKLYSSQDMSGRGAENLAGDFDANWDDEPARWVDLNAPSFSKQDNRLSFPIVDPRAFRSRNSNTSIEGFEYSSTTSNSKTVAGVVTPPQDDTDQQRLPMPVEWLYVLDDGTLGYLDADDSFIATTGSGSPSQYNPISARLAFWTDDESTKININTASEGTHWDMPRYQSSGEERLSTHQPARREFNRYPGSPAMVSMSSVFYPHQDVSDTQTQDLIELAPKVGWGGTKADTVVAPDNAIEVDEQHLYTTVDELLYRHATNETDPVGESPRTENQIFKGENDESINDARLLLEKSRFFLTANSNAPELTLHGTPRMSMWPLHARPNVGNTSAFDHLIEYCTRIGGVRYYWRRNDPNSRHAEVYGNADGDNRRLLYDYLDKHSGVRIPGYGSTLAQKYSSGGGGSGENGETLQILTQCWDYIRTSNLTDPFVTSKYGNGSGQVASSCLCGGSSQHQQRWDKLGEFPAKGLGRLYFATEITLVFAASTGPELTPPLVIGDRAPFMEVGMLIEVFCPSHGFSKISPSSYIQLIGERLGSTRIENTQPGSFTFGGVAAELDLSSSTTPPQNGSPAHSFARTGIERTGTRAWGGHGGPLMFSEDIIQFRQTENQSVYFPVPASGNITVTIGGDDPMRVIMYDNPTVGINNLIQFATVRWPSEFDVPAPRGPKNEANGDPREARWKDRIEGIANGELDRNQLISLEDVTRSMVVSHGDYRHTMAKRVSEEQIFQPHFDFLRTDPETDGPVNHAHSLTDADGFKFRGFSVERDMIPGANYDTKFIPDFPLSPDNDNFALLASRDYTFSMDPAITGDWDTGLAFQLDGPYSGRPDDGSSQGNNPYFDEDQISEDSNQNALLESLFSPNRLINGPGMFGSLPTGVRANIPWRTLLFRPDPTHFGAANNPSNGDVPDHLLMDLFWMPTVEPYAISMPFATRGKINLNYQIIPFDNIKRATALHALMKAERVVAIPTSAGRVYKDKDTRGGEDEWRRKIDAYETLLQAENLFEDNRIFRSASEICELYLVPENQTLGSRSNNDYPSMRAFWAAHQLTGDNVKEHPYANLYPRLTTKSNVFRVHMIVQTLKKVRSSDVNVFDPEKDHVSGQWRGSAIIERFIDPNDNDNRIPDYRTTGTLLQGRQSTLESFYNYRVLHVKQFTS